MFLAFLLVSSLQLIEEQPQVVDPVRNDNFERKHRAARERIRGHEGKIEEANRKFGRLPIRDHQDSRHQFEVGFGKHRFGQITGPRELRGPVPCSVCLSAYESIHNNLETEGYKDKLLQKCSKFHPKIQTPCGLIATEWYDAIAKSKEDANQTCFDLQFCRFSPRTNKFSAIWENSTLPEKELTVVKDEVSCGICEMIVGYVLDKSPRSRIHLAKLADKFSTEKNLSIVDKCKNIHQFGSQCQILTDDFLKQAEDGSYARSSIAEICAGLEKCHPLAH